MTNSPTHIHKYPLQLPAPVWERMSEILNGCAANTFMVAAVAHMLTLSKDKRDAIIADYLAMKAK